ncbi:MAG: hypothetical protein ABL995_16095 [Bryobacteraceae bacterium]
MNTSILRALVGAGFLLSACVHAQTLDFRMRAGEPSPWISTAYPEDQIIRVQTPNSSARISGEMSNACGGPCFVIRPHAGGSPGELEVSFTGHGAEILKVGVHSSTVDIGQQRWNIRLNVIARRPYLPFVYLSGYPKGCRKSDPKLPALDTCVITNEQPAEKLDGLGRPGDVLLDPQFGFPIHRLTEAGFFLAYSTVRMFSATARYVLGADPEGFLHVWERGTNKQVGERFSGSNASQTVWDPSAEEKIWFIEGGQVGYRDVQKGKVTIAADYRKPWGGRPSFNEMSTGGTADNTDDNWWVFTDQKVKMVCAIDLKGLIPANQEEHLYCTSYGALGVGVIDFPQVTQIDSESKKRYVLLLAEPRAHVFTVDTAQHKLTYEFEMPPQITTPHSDVGQDAKGRQLLFWAWYDPYGNKSFAATGLLNRGPQLVRPLEEGGGLALLFPMPEGFRWDAHYGCNWKAECVVSIYSDPVPGGIPNWTITDVRAGSPCVVQFEGDTPFKDGTQIAIGGVGEMRGVNGVHKLRVLDRRTVVLDGQACSGRYGQRKGHAAESRPWAPMAPGRDWIVHTRLDREARPILIHRSKLWAEHGDLSFYWASPRAGLSRDGRFIGFGSNLGLPELNSIYWTEAEITETTPPH